MHAFISNTIPIYWGNPEIHKDFNPKSFINSHAYNSFEEFVERIKEIDQNDELYYSILDEPPFLNNEIPEQFKPYKLKEFFISIFDQDIIAARRRPFYGTTKKYETKLKSIIKLQNKVRSITKIFR